MNACRVARSTREIAALVNSSSSSSRPTPQLLWQVFIVLFTCSSTTFDSSTTVCTSSCASSRCLNSCSPFCHLGPTSLANLFASSATCIRSQTFFGTCGLFSSHPRGRIENCSFFQMMCSFSVGLVIGRPIPGSMIVTFLSSATSPCKR